MKNFKFDKDTVSKFAGVASAIVMGIFTIANALGDQKKDREFKEMKKLFDELQNK